MSSILNNSLTFNYKNGSLFTTNPPIDVEYKILALLSRLDIPIFTTNPPSDVEYKILALLSRLDIPKLQGTNYTISSNGVIEDNKQMPLNEGQLKLIKEVLPKTVDVKINRTSSSMNNSIGKLPKDIFFEIFHWLNQSDLGYLRESCSSLYSATEDPRLWKKPNVPSSFDNLQLFLCKHGAKIEELNLNGKLRIWYEKEQIKFLKSLHLYCPNLTHLDLSSNILGSEGANALAEELAKLKALTHLNFYYNHIRDEGAKALATALPNLQDLKHLDLSDNQIRDEGAKALAKELSKLHALKHLDLSYNYIHDEGANALATALPNLQALEHLNLRRNHIGIEGAKAVAEALSNLQVLTHLDLSYSDIGIAGAKAVAKALSKLQALTHLDLSVNDIRDEGAEALAKELPKLPALEHLNLCYNFIGDVGTIALAKELPKLKALEYLNLKGNLLFSIQVKKVLIEQYSNIILD